MSGSILLLLIIIIIIIIIIINKMRALCWRSCLCVGLQRDIASSVYQVSVPTLDLVSRSRLLDNQTSVS